MFDLPLPIPVSDVTRDWHPLDVALGVCVLMVALNAARRGFVREIGTLIGLGVGLLAAGRFGLPVAELLAERIGRWPLLDEAAFALVVGIVAAGVTVMAGLLRGSLRLPGLPVADSLAGLALGAIEGSAALGLVVLLVNRFEVLGISPFQLDGSTLAPVFLRWWIVVAQSLPLELGMPRSL